MAAHPPAAPKPELAPINNTSSRLLNTFVGGKPLPKTPGSDEEAVREGSEPAVEGLSTVGLAGIPIEAAATQSLRPFLPAIRGVIGGAAGHYLGREAGGMLGPTGAHVGGMVGGLAGGLYGAGGGEVPTSRERLAEMLSGEQEPPIGSPDNPAFHSKLPARLPASLRGDPFTPATAKPDLAPINAGAKTGVAVLPEPRAPFEGETPNYMASVPRGKLTRLAIQGKPGAGTQLQQLGQPILYAPKGAGIESPSMDALRQSLRIAPPDAMNLSEGENLGPGLGTEHTIQKGGQRVGSVTVEPKGNGALHVHWLGGDLAENGVTRSDVLNSLREQYPDTQKITYDRRRLAKGDTAATTEPRVMNVSGSKKP
jgi:hypothetical protein